MPPPSNSASTLELAVNEQQMQNMSRVDLGRPSDETDPTRLQQQQDYAQQPTGGLSGLKQWPARFCGSLGARLDEAKAKSETRTQYALEVLQAFSGILIWVLCFVFTIIMPVILFFVGLTNLDDCPVRPSLPYLVFAMGFLMTASNLFNLALGLDLPVLSNHSQLSIEIKNTIASIVNIIFNCVVALIYILTAYKSLTLKTRKPETSNDNNNNDQPAVDEAEVSLAGCNPTLVGFTFWFITLTLSSIVILSLLGAVLFAYNRHRLAIIRGSTPRSQPQAAAAANGPMNGQINPAFYGDSTNRV